MMFLYCYGSRDACATARTSSSGWRNAVAASGVGRFRFVERTYIYFYALCVELKTNKRTTHDILIIAARCRISSVGVYAGRFLAFQLFYFWLFYVYDMRQADVFGFCVASACLAAWVSYWKWRWKIRSCESDLFQESVEPVNRAVLSDSITNRFVMLLSQQLTDSVKREAMVRVLNELTGAVKKCYIL